ncbi:MAG: flagellar biosynthetic protein FliO [Lachnospiraceae bacterium]|nr:flagellar biosynthetic protein FliO [Lachnospiraceae bacterium]
MALAKTGSIDTAAQFLTIVIIFIFVLAATYVTTKWIANYQKERSVNNNFEIIEISRLAANKYIEIVRCGEKYLAIAVCKDTVTLLCELSKEQLNLDESEKLKGSGFKEILDRARNVNILEKENDLKKNK